MKYEKHFSCEALDFAEVEFQCQSLESIVARFAATYHREVDMSVIERKKYDFLRNSIASAMTDGLDDFLANNPGYNENIFVMADEIEMVNTDDGVKFKFGGYTVKSDVDEVTLSLARAIFTYFDADEFSSIIEEEFLDAIMHEVKSMPSENAKPKVVTNVLTETKAEEIVSGIIDGMPNVFKPKQSANVTPIIPTKMEQKPKVDETTTQSADDVNNIIDPKGLYKKYAANFADIMAVSDIQNAVSNTFSREGNRIVLTSVMYDEEDGKAITVVKYDAVHGGKTTRTTEHEGNRTRTYDWRTPSKFGVAMASLPEDGGDFEDEVLSRTLTKECCKKFGIRFIPTSKEERNANRGKSGASKQAAHDVADGKTTEVVEPKVEETEIVEAEVVEVATDTTEEVTVEVVEAEMPEAEEVECEVVEETPTAEVEAEVVETVEEIVEEPSAEVVVEETPKESAVSKHSLKGTLRCDKFDEILMWVKNDVPVYLCGPSGTGKDITCMQIAEELGLEFHCHNAVQNTFDVVGFTDARGVYHETELFLAWTKGGIISFTELDASDSQVLNILNEGYSNGYMVFEGKRYAKHPDCRIMASGNTCGTGATNLYTGRMRIDEATLGRFELIEVDYDIKVETSIAGEEIAEFAADFRSAAKECGIELVRSYRQSKHLAIAMREENFPRIYGSKAMEFAIDRCFRRYMSADDFKMVALHCKAAKNTYTRTLRKMAEAI